MPSAVQEYLRWASPPGRKRSERNRQLIHESGSGQPGPIMGTARRHRAKHPTVVAGAADCARPGNHPAVCAVRGELGGVSVLARATSGAGDVSTPGRTGTRTAAARAAEKAETKTGAQDQANSDRCSEAAAK